MVQKLTPRTSFLYLITAILFFVLLIIIVFRGLLIFSSENSPDLSATFIDVGQGDAILLQLNNSGDLFNKTQVLIDGGPNRSVLRGLGDEMPLFDRTIELVIASHPDADHIGGLGYVMENYRIQNLIDNGAAASSSAYDRYSHQLKYVDNYFIADTVDQYVIEKKLTITILPVEPVFDDRNDESIVVRIDHGSNSILLTGDASTEVEEYLIDNYQNLIDVDILKLGHHGSRKSTSLEFLQTTTPTDVIISAPIDSRYGHPHSEVLDNLKKFSAAKIHMTGIDGDINFSANFNDLIWNRN